MDMAEQLVDYQIAHNISMQKLAQQIGLSTATLKGIINRQSTPSALTCYKISVFLKGKFCRNDFLGNK